MSKMSKLGSWASRGQGSTCEHGGAGWGQQQPKLRKGKGASGGETETDWTASRGCLSGRPPPKTRCSSARRSWETSAIDWIQTQTPGSQGSKGQKEQMKSIQLGPAAGHWFLEDAPCDWWAHPGPREADALIFQSKLEIWTNSLVFESTKQAKANICGSKWIPELLFPIPAIFQSHPALLPTETKAGERHKEGQGCPGTLMLRGRGGVNTEAQIQIPKFCIFQNKDHTLFRDNLHKSYKK